MYITKLLIKIITIGSNLDCGIRDRVKIARIIKTEIYCQILIHHANLISNSLIFRYDNDTEHTVNIAKHAWIENVQACESWIGPRAHTALTLLKQSGIILTSTKGDQHSKRSFDCASRSLETFPERHLQELREPLPKRAQNVIKNNGHAKY